MIQCGRPIAYWSHISRRKQRRRGQYRLCLVPSPRSSLPSHRDGGLSGRFRQQGLDGSGRFELDSSPGINRDQRRTTINSHQSSFRRRHGTPTKYASSSGIILLSSIRHCQRRFHRGGSIDSSRQIPIEGDIKSIRYATTMDWKPRDD